MADDHVKVAIEMSVPAQMAGGLAYAVQQVVEPRGAKDVAIAFDPEPPGEYGVSALEAAKRRIHGPPLVQGAGA